MVWLLIAVALYVLVLLGITWVSLHPYRIPIFMSPGGLGCPQEDVEFTTSDGIALRGWWSEANGLPSPAPASSPQNPTPNTQRPTVAILSHGYMMNRSELSPVVPLLLSKGISCLVYDFRGHGRSGSKRSYLGYREVHDVEAAVAFARSRHPNAKIVLIGSSMGAASSALAIGQNPALADALILDSAYSRLSSAVIGWWRFLGGTTLAILFAPTTIVAIPFAGFNPWSVDVSKALKNAGNVPILFLHGEKDTLALPSEAKANHAACEGPASMVWFPNCGHSEGRWIQPKTYNDALIMFLDEHVLGE
jgi:pimeloyl-ACP methyl ester carboxylesterase